MRYVIIFIVFALFVSGCTTSFIKVEYKLKENDILQYGLSSNKNFLINAQLKDSLKLKWIFSTHGSFSNNSFVIANNYLFANDLSGRIYCFDLETGKTKGLLIYKGTISNTPVIMKNLLVFVYAIRNTNLSEVVFYDLFNAKELHSVEIEGKVLSELLLVDDGVVLLTSKGSIMKFGFRGEYLFNHRYPLNSFTHQKSDNEDHVSVYSKSNLLLYKNEIIINGVNGEILFIDKSSGNFIRKTKVSPHLLNNGIVLDNNLFFSDKGGSLFKFSLTDYKVISKHDLEGEFLAAPVTDRNNIFFVNLSGEIVTLDLKSFNFISSKSGKKKIGNVLFATPLLLDNLLIVPDLDRKVIFINKESGKIIRTLEYEKRVKSTPVFYNDLLFIGVDDGEIYVYENF